MDYFYVLPMTMLSTTFPVSFWAAIKVSKCISADWTKMAPKNTHEVVMAHPDNKNTWDFMSYFGTLLDYN